MNSTSFETPSKTFLFGSLNPQHKEQLSAFRSKLVEVLQGGGFWPPEDPFDVVLLDVSGSMQNAFSDSSVQDNLQRIAQLNPKILER